MTDVARYVDIVIGAIAAAALLWFAPKNGRAKAVRFATVAALCEALDCQPGDLLRFVAEDTADGRPQPLATRQRALTTDDHQR